MKIPVEKLRELVRYDAETGHLFWLPRPVDLFGGSPQANVLCAVWNRRNAGQRALSWLSANGYPCGSILGRSVLAHHVCWALLTGEWPSEDIDHINGVRDDNRACNLRVVTRKVNARNQKLRRTNTSGQMGVYWSHRSGKWLVTINRAHVGLYDDFEKAVAARKAAEARFGFHPNHGRIQHA